MKKIKGKLGKLLKKLGLGVTLGSGVGFGPQTNGPPKVEKVEPNSIVQERTDWNSDTFKNSDNSDKSKKVELNETDLKSLKKSNTLVRLSSGEMIAFQKKIYTKEEREAEKAYFQQLMPQKLLENTKELEDEFETEDSNLDEKISNEEILALEGSGQIQLVKQSPGNGVDGSSWIIWYPGRSPKNIPPSQNGSKPPRFPSGLSRDQAPRTSPRIVGSQSQLSIQILILAVKQSLRKKSQ